MVAENWKQEVDSWLTRAHELGLIDSPSTRGESFKFKVKQLRTIAEKDEFDSIISARNIKDASEELVLLRGEEQTVSRQLYEVQQRYFEMKQLSRSMNDYDQSLQIQLERLEVSEWLRNISKENSLCPFCGNSHNNSMEELNSLCDAIAYIEKTAGEMKVVPAAFEREMIVVEQQMQVLSEHLTSIRIRIKEESRKGQQSANEKFTLTAISRFLGRLESSLQTYDKIGADNELEQKIMDLDNRLRELSNIVNEKEINNKINDALSYIQLEANKIVQGLDVERPSDPIEFLIKDLTIRVKNIDGRSDYLWEIGSASNWLAYHIAIILAFQKYFRMRGKVQLPNFVIFDQPSQVYFPQRLVKKISSKDEEKENELDDEDKKAVRKIFSTLSKYISDMGYDIQIIVMEHADEDIWGEIEDMHLVKRWRGDEKLIPAEWI